MLEHFKKFEIETSHNIFGGDHGDDEGIPNDGDL